MKSIALILSIFTILSANISSVRLNGTVDMGMKHLVQRVLEELSDTDTLILHITTDGGRIDAALEISEMLFTTPTHTVAFIENRALSAGALISIACNEIYMQRGSIIGDSAPVTSGEQGPVILGEKIQSPLRAKFRLYASENGYPEALAEAMVTPDLEIYRVITEDGKTYLRGDEIDDVEGDRQLVIRKGELLTLSDEEAMEAGFSKGTYQSFQNFIKSKSYTITNSYEATWSEIFVSFIGTIAPFLLMIGMAALYMESRAPGVGLPGLIGVIALTLVFTSQYMAGLAAHTELLILALGILLLFVEIFILPGFGIAGLAGIFCIAVAGFLSLQNFVLPSPDSPWQQELFMENITSTALAFFGALILIAIFFIALFPKINRFLPGTILDQKLAETSVEKTKIEKHSSLIGREGRVIKSLYPTGIVEVDGEHLDATSKGYAIDIGETVKVIAVEGIYLIVAPISKRD